MSRLKSIASGNWTDASTWGVVDSTSHNDSESIATLVTNSYVACNAFTPGAITIDGVAIKLSYRNPSPSGTFSIAIDQAGSTVAGTEVTINVSDLPEVGTGLFNGGWSYFKFSAPVTLLAATLYSVKIKTSVYGQLNCFAQASSNWARMLVTTTTQAPVAGDDMVVAGGYTGAGTADIITVTMNETASTDYGSGVFSITGSGTPSLSSYALHISGKGVLTWGTTAATNYQLKLSGNLNVYGQGVYNMGTVGTPCPRDSTMTLIMDCLANVEIGIMVRNLGEFNTQGLSRTSGKNIYYCKLNTDEAIASTSLGVDTDTGWLDNDEIVVASTTRTSAQCEAGTLNGSAGSSSLTVDGFAGAGGGLAFAHSGTSPTQAEIMLLTRNVLICGASATLQTYLDIKQTATIDCDWTHFKWFGSGTTNKRGIDNGATTGSVSFQYCSIDKFSVVNSIGYNQTGTTGNGVINFSNNVIWNTAADSMLIAATSNTWVCDSNITMNSGAAALPARIGDVGGTFTNNIFVGGGQGIILSEVANITGVISGNVWHSNANVLQFLGITGGTISNTTVWRNNAAPLQLTNAISNVIIDGLTMFGNTTNNLNLLICVNTIINNFVSSGDSTFSTATGVNIAGGINMVHGIRFTNSTFGAVDGIKTAHTQDVLCGTQYADVVFENCLFASPVEVASQSLLLSGSRIGSQKHNQTAGNHRSWFKEGTIRIDTSIHNGSPSERLTPNSASLKLKSGVMRIAVSNGEPLTVSVKVRESVVGDSTDYNGNRIRLLVKKNTPLGIVSDTVLATATSASVGSFETISGATASVTDDGVLEFYVDCDGTTGWVNVDDWDCSTLNDTKGMKHWQDGQPVVYGNNSSGGIYKPMQSPVFGGGFMS